MPREKEEITGAKAPKVLTAADIEAAFQKHFHNSPGISDNTAIYNRLRAFADDLKAQISE